MESTRISSIQMNNSFNSRFNNLNLNIKEKNKKDISINNKNTQSDSTTIEEKKDINSLKKYNSLKLINYDKVKLIYLRKRSISINIKKTRENNKSAKNMKTNNKLLIFQENKNISGKINKNERILKIFINDNCCNTCNVLGCTKNSIYLLKKYAPKINYFYDYKYDLSYKNNNYINSHNKKFPNVLLNHLLLKNIINVNNNNKANYLSISIIQRIKAKNITMLYYRPLKKCK